MSFSWYTHLTCTKCGLLYDKSKVINVCTVAGCGGALFACYKVDKQNIAPKGQKNNNVSALPFHSRGNREKSIWRWHEMMPAPQSSDIVSLGEGGTPCLKANRLGELLGLANLWIKDESNNPTGSFKARGLGAAVTMAKTLGVKSIALPTAGNAGGAAAAYAARAGLLCHIFMPEDTPRIFKLECEAYGAKVTLVDGLIDDCGKIVAQRKEIAGWFDMSTLKEPYRVEGKKTLGYELVEFFDGTVPEVIIYPTGGGTGLIGMWKAFDELEKLGWIDSRRPRMISVQAEGCAPIVKAFDERKTISTRFENAHTYASGLRVPKAYADYLILEIIRKSKGCAIAVNDKDIREGVGLLGMCEGIYPAPEGGAALIAVAKLLETRQIDPKERIVVFNTGSAYKYL